MLWELSPIIYVSICTALVIKALVFTNRFLSILQVNIILDQFHLNITL